MKRHLLTISDLFRKTEFKVALAAVLLLSLIPLRFGRYDRVVGAIADAGHFWFYFAAYFYLSRVTSKPKRLLSGLIVISGVIEVIQPFVDRDGNLQDFAVSSLGAICGFVFSLKYPLILRIIATAICSVPLFFPIYWRLEALRYQERLFPELAVFKDDQWLSLWEPTTPDKSPSSTLYLDPAGKLVVRAMGTQEWPGVIYLNQFLSWNEYDALEIEVEGYSDTQLSIRVDDDQDCKEFNDRFNKSYSIKSGPNRILIDVEELRITRGGRLMNIDKIKRVALFTTARQRSEKLFAIRGMRLIKGPL